MFSNDIVLRFGINKSVVLIVRGGNIVNLEGCLMRLKLVC